MSLLDNPTSMHAAFYHIGRIGKFLQEISRDALNDALGTMQQNEYRAFRNFIRHGDDKADISTIEDYQFLVRYAALFTHHLPDVLSAVAVGPMLNPVAI